MTCDINYLGKSWMYSLSTDKLISICRLNLQLTNQKSRPLSWYPSVKMWEQWKLNSSFLDRLWQYIRLVWSLEERFYLIASCQYTNHGLIDLPDIPPKSPKKDMIACSCRYKNFCTM